ncbi:hypothetical protein J2848_003847 [Azospirillum lipoferum]|nr:MULTISPECIES: hypothetical protein [Azospirillum]MCP1612167.1 hypothetical protein [Azospirillum lipoferum]MDW5536611.1 hypothetical protein [Azospirillum sp. NL1]
MSALDLSPLFFSLSVIKQDYLLILDIARNGLHSLRIRRARSLRH